MIQEVSTYLVTCDTCKTETVTVVGSGCQITMPKGWLPVTLDLRGTTPTPPATCIKCQKGKP